MKQKIEIICLVFAVGLTPAAVYATTASQCEGRLTSCIGTVITACKSASNPSACEAALFPGCSSAYTSCMEEVDIMFQ